MIGLSNSQRAGILAALLTYICIPCSLMAQEPERGAEREPDRQHLILIVGAPGTDEYRATFQTWSRRWQDTAVRGAIKCSVIGVTDQIGSDSVSEAETDAERIQDAIRIAGARKTTEPLWIVFIGHGTFDGRTASWNLQGPDVSAEELAIACSEVQRPLAVIACSSCSAPFINVLSGPDRVVISATKDGNQIQYSRFGDGLSNAISTLEADIDRDGQTSLLEAWLFAARRTAEFYESEGRLATEHSLLDDNGDGKGVRSELYSGDRVASNVETPELIDGRIAARWHLVRSEEEQKLNPQQRETRDALELQLEQVRARKDSMQEDEYLQQLEAVLLQLAELYELVGK